MTAMWCIEEAKIYITQLIPTTEYNYKNLSVFLLIIASMRVYNFPLKLIILFSL